MRALAEYALRGRQQAWFLALLFSILPFLGWLSIGIIGLVTLRKGAVEGLLVMLWASLPTLAIAISQNNPLLFIYSIIYGNALCWLLAIILRATISWLTVILVAVFLGVLGIIAIHVFVPDNVAWFAMKLQQYIVKVNEVKQADAQLPPEQMALFVKEFSKVAIRLIVATIMISGLINLGIARWMQALVFNPGGLRKELYQIRLNPGVSLVLLLGLSLSYLQIPVLDDLVPVLSIPFILASLSLVHRITAHDQNQWLWLGMWYIIFVFSLIVFPLQTMGLLIILASIDSVIDLAEKFPAQKTRP